MTGVYLVAAELSRRGYIVSPTSRSAYGADLLVTDQDCQRSWAVQVKTNARTFNFWLLGSKARELRSKNFVYVLVNLRKNHTDFYVVPSAIIAKRMHESKPSKTRKSTWYSVYLERIAKYQDKWEIFEK